MCYTTFMLQINPQNIIPITEARAKLDDLVSGAQGNNFYVISRQGKAKAAIIDVEYLMDLQRKLDFAEMRELHKQLQQGFREYLIKKGYNPDKMTDEEAEKILQSIANQ